MTPSSPDTSLREVSPVHRDEPLVLVVDDEPALTHAIRYSLQREGWRVEIAEDGPSALEKHRELQPDLIVLDVMLPGMDGLQVCRAIRTESDVPVLFLSARSEDVDRIIGLEIGGDDYLTKPFVMRELVARVRVGLRRVARSRRASTVSDSAAGLREPGQAEPKSAQVGRVTIDFAGRQVRVDGVEVSLKPKEFDLLAYLAERPNVAVSREALLRDVWNYSLSVDTRTVDVHVRGLRQKLEVDPGRPQFIETVRGHGYRLRSA
jgi:DNA-binding response OmpR family regulator